MKTFVNLCNELKISSALVNDNEIATLTAWTEDNISHDMNKRTELKSYVTFYLETFLPAITSDLTAPLPALEGQSALETAAFYGFDAWLARNHEQIKPSAIINKPNEYGMRPLHIACIKGNVNTVKQLLNSGANVMEVNNENQTAAHSALILPGIHSDALKERKASIFSMLYKKQPELIRTTDEFGENPQQQMCVHNYAKLLKHVITETMQPNSDGHYPIHIALMHGSEEAALVLLDKTNNIMMQTDREGRNALHYAARHSSLNVLEKCIHLADDINVTDRNGKTALMYAQEHNSKDIIDLLKKNNAIEVPFLGVMP